MEKVQTRPVRIRTFLPWVGLTACFGFSFAMLALSRNLPAFAEWYAVTVYPMLVRLGGGFWGAFPFSCGELLIYALTVCVAVRIIRLLMLCRDKQRLRRMLFRTMWAILWIFGVVLLLFTVYCGINYYRLPFSEVSGFNLSPSSVQELADLEIELIEQTNMLALQLQTNASGASVIEGHASIRQAPHALAALADSYPALKGYYPSAKPVLFSHGMSYLDITGVYFPLTIEANVNIDVPGYHIPATACHELSHLSGFMREDEANFIAYLACRASDDVSFQYSGNMLALIHIRNALYQADPVLASSLKENMNERVHKDFEQNTLYWKQFEGPIAVVSDVINDTYLKANAQSDGLKSYGRMVDLLLADYRIRHEVD